MSQRFQPTFGQKSANDRANQDLAIAVANFARTHQVAKQGLVAPIATRTEHIQTSHTFTVGVGVRYNGTAWVVADGTGAATSRADGIVSAVAGDWFELTSAGLVRGLSSLTAGAVYYFNASGVLTTTATAQKVGRAMTTTEILVDMSPVSPVVRGALITTTTLTSGSGTHTYNGSTQFWHARLWGGGASGGSGATISSSPARKFGGGGGGSGAILDIFGEGNPSSLPYAVGAGGSAASSGSDGTDGANTTLGDFIAGGGVGGLAWGSSPDAMGGLGGNLTQFGWYALHSGKQLCVGIPGQAGQPSHIVTLSFSSSTHTAEGGRGGSNGAATYGRGGKGSNEAASSTAGQAGGIVISEFY